MKFAKGLGLALLAPTITLISFLTNFCHTHPFSEFVSLLCHKPTLLPKTLKNLLNTVGVKAISGTKIITDLFFFSA